jgi:iron complex transport system permease protein
MAARDLTATGIRAQAAGVPAVPVVLRTVVVWGATGALLVLAAAVALAAGAPRLSPADLATILLDGPGARDADAAFVVWELRLPRLSVGVLAGAALGASGLLLQDALRNPLAGPELLGVGTGASLAVAVVTVFGLAVPPALLPGVALAGGAAAGAVVLLAAGAVRGPVRLLLVGAALTSLLGAMILGVLALSVDTMMQDTVLRFLTGSISGVTWTDAAVAVPWVTVGLVATFTAGGLLNVLRLGDDVASGLGVRVARARLGLLVLAAALVAPAVAVAGPIAFVALLAPHAARLALRTADARRVLPLAAAFGAVVVAASDVAGRLVLFPRELPAGAWTVLLGGPLVIVLLRRTMRRAGHT